MYLCMYLVKTENLFMNLVHRKKKVEEHQLGLAKVND